MLWIKNIPSHVRLAETLVTDPRGTNKNTVAAVMRPLDRTNSAAFSFGFLRTPYKSFYRLSRVPNRNETFLVVRPLSTDRGPRRRWCLNAERFFVVRPSPGTPGPDRPRCRRPLRRRRKDGRARSPRSASSKLCRFRFPRRTGIAPAGRATSFRRRSETTTRLRV